MKYVNLSVARSSLPSLVDDTERVVITRGGQPVAVLVNIDDYRAMHIMQALATEPSTLQKIMQTHERVRSGDLAGLEEFPLPEHPPDRRGLKDRRSEAVPITEVIDQMKEAVREEVERMRAVRKVDDATIEKVAADLGKRLARIQRDHARRLTEPDAVKTR